MRILLLTASVVFSSILFGQNQVQVKVTDEENIPLFGAHIHAEIGNTVTNVDGETQFEITETGSYRFQVSYLGFKPLDTLIQIHQLPQKIDLIMITDQDELAEVFLTQKASVNIQNTEKINAEYIQDNFAGSLAASLDRIPGVNSIEIGAGASKPIIRGLSFNRIVVAENGSRHEGQQWGADHGLEIDALAIDDIEIIKSVGAIEYGTDAIGGVVQIKTDATPKKEGLTGEYRAFGRSVNQTLANSINLNYKKDDYFFKFRSTLSSYGDYNLPTDTITYLSVKMPVQNRRLMNTAGRERNVMIQGGFQSESFKSTLTLSNNYLKAGFFPGAHGVPSVLRVRDDGDRRNIDFPFQRVNHLKLVNNNQWFFNKSDLSLMLSYQNNRRQEEALFHTHYAGQQPPENDPNLELDFNLNSYEAKIKYDHYFNRQHHSTFGIHSQYQNNEVGGYNFLLPSYHRFTTGIFALHDYDLTNKLALQLGVRADYGNLQTDRFYDPLLFSFLVNRRNLSVEEANALAERSSNTNSDFWNANALLGLSYQASSYWQFSGTFGTTFRFPTAIELAANGIHHGSFRHEQGNENLSTEQGWVADAKVSFNLAEENLLVSFSPYWYYFDNYIFLRPSGRFSPLPHGGQIYEYTESGALLTGFEVFVEKQFFNSLTTTASFEYLQNQQVTGSTSRDFPLPFTPPINAFFEVSYDFNNSKNWLQQTRIFANSTVAWRQTETAQNEAETPGYGIFGGGLQSDLKIGDFKANIMLQAFNVFDKKYFNHTNFYRALEIPEMGRNIQLMIRIPFDINSKTTNPSR
ncbi:TonB-dependent receptor [Psychroflexus maritimus]|uniref:TonB-dependent receptor n=1 Tax=Psychroflexus maritimus TaxID=2714865 RepID=A0A967DZ57_9FLAO|nr:TonB-dependent receptor [Psychroflexus maritimus]NGZ89853.1 TonB-dependent receptor [Psychroflexus maritimus]